MHEINSTNGPGDITENRTTLFKSFIDFLKKNSRFYLIYGNVVIIMIILYIICVSVFASNIDLDPPNILSQIGYSIFYSSMILIYPYFGMYKKDIHNPKKFIFAMFLVITIATIILDRLDIFLGKENFLFDWHYGHDYLYGVKNSLFTQEYNPFGSSWYFVFIYIINPNGSALIDRLVCNCWGVGIYYMVYKISTIKELGIDRNKLANAFIYISVSGIQILLLIVTQKHDFFEIFLSLIGIYFTLKKRWFLSAFILVYCGFFKIYAFFWIAGILIIFLKQKNWGTFIKYFLNTAISIIFFISLAFVIEGDELIQTLLSFKWQFLTEPLMYNLNWDFYLSFLNIPSLNILPSILIFGFFLFYAIKYAKKIDLNFFINSIALVLIFYSAVNFQYLIWIIPLIGLDFMNNTSQYRKATFIFEVIQVNVAWCAYAWLMILGFRPYLTITSFSQLMGLDPGKYLVVLVVQFIICILMDIGFYSYIIIPNFPNKKPGILNRLNWLKKSQIQ